MVGGDILWVDWRHRGGPGRVEGGMVASVCGVLGPKEWSVNVPLERGCVGDTHRWSSNQAGVGSLVVICVWVMVNDGLKSATEVVASLLA